MFQQAKPKTSRKSGQEEAEVQARLRPWVEKYRPKSIEDVSSQEHIVQVLRKTLMSSNLPHMLFYGPPGTGKTSTILALARQLFGPDLMKSRVLELNASDERGITVVREKIKNFAKLAVSNANVCVRVWKQLSLGTTLLLNFPCPPYKIIVLDEADSMTQDAQSALRRIMEQYSRITRFCLVCNYVTRIIEPLASRCSKFRFRMLDSSSTRERLEMIAREEGVRFEDGVLDTLIKTSDGDLRRAITYLQSASRLHATAGEGGQPTAITPRSIVEIAGVVPDSVVRRLGLSVGVEPPPRANGDVEMDADDDEARVGKASWARRGRSEFERIREEVRLLAREGYSASQLLTQLHDYLITHPSIGAARKARAALQLAEADKGLVDGGDEELQLLALCLRLHAALK